MQRGTGTKPKAPAAAPKTGSSARPAKGPAGARPVKKTPSKAPAPGGRKSTKAAAPPAEELAPRHVDAAFTLPPLEEAGTPVEESPTPVLPPLNVAALSHGETNQGRRTLDSRAAIAPAREKADDLRTDNFLAETGVLGSEVDRQGPSTPRANPRESTRITSGPAGVGRATSPAQARTSSPRGRSSGAAPGAEVRRRTSSPSATAAALRRISLSQGTTDPSGVPRLSATTPRMSQAQSSATETDDAPPSPVSTPSANGRSSAKRPPRSGSTSPSAASTASTQRQTQLATASSKTYIDAATASMAALYVDCYSPQDISRLPFMAAEPPTHVCLRSMPITTSVVANILSYCNRYEIHDIMFDNCVFTLYDYTWFHRITGLKTIRLKGQAVGTRIVTQILKHAIQVQNVTLFECNHIAALPALATKMCRIRSVQLINTDFSEEALTNIVNCPTVREVMLLHVGLNGNIFELFNSDHIDAIHLVGCPDLYYTSKDPQAYLSKSSPRKTEATSGTDGGAAALSVRSLLVTDCESLSLESLPWSEMTRLEELSILHHEQQALPFSCLQDVFRKCSLKLLRLQHVFVDEYVVRQIQMCVDLEELNLSYCKGFHGMAEIWRALPRLRRLNVSHSEMDSADLEGLHRCRELEQVFAQHCPYVQDFDVFRGLPGLQLLDLSGCTNLADEGFRGDYDCHGLRCLILSGCTRLRDIGGLAALRGLEVLRLSECHVRQAGLMEVLRSSADSLGELDLERCDNVHDLSPVPFHRCQALTHVSLSGSNATDATLAAMAESPKLFSVNVSYCEGITSVGPLGKRSELRSLNLSFSAVNDAGMTAYTELPGAKYLETIQLRGCTAVSDLACLGKLKRVTRMDLSASTVDPSTTLPAIAAGCEVLEEINLQECMRVRDISALGRSRSVRRINASLTSITDGCLSGLAQGRAIEELELSGCEGLRNVSALSSLQLLQRLNLSNTSVDVSSMAGFYQCSLLWDISLANGKNVRDIAVLSTIASLQRLDVSGTDVEDRSFAVPWRTVLLEELDLHGCGSLNHIAANAFKALTCLRRVDLAHTNIDDASLERLAVCTALEELILDDCPNLSNLAVLGGLKNLCLLSAARTPVTGSSFADFSKCEKLTELDLTGCPNTDDLSALGYCRHLRVLRLAGSGTSDATFAQTGRRCPWKESILESLDLSGCPQIHNIPAIASLSRLEVLDLSYSGVTDVAITNVAQAASLRELRLAGCAHVVAPTALGKMRQLKVLDLDGSAVARLTDEEGTAGCDGNGASGLWFTTSLIRASFRGCQSLKNVSALRELPRLAVLDLSESTCAEESFTAVPWSGCVSLRVLSMRGCRTIRGLSGLRAMRHLSTLILAESTAEKDSVEGLRECPSLEHVDMSGCTGIKNIGAFADLPRLRSLNAAGSSITSTSFAGPWTCRSLTEVNLRGCVMVDSLSGLASLPALRRLDLAHTSASDAGVRAISKVATLEELDLSGCRGVRSATSLSHLRRLRTLDLSGSLVDNTSLIALPMCTRLEVLDLRACDNITDAFFAHDFTHLRVLHMPPLDRIIGSFVSHCPSLERLSLQGCPATRHTASWFESMTFLKALDMHGSTLEPSFFDSLVCCKTLEELDLSACPAIEGVSALRALPNLKHLSLSETTVTNALCEEVAECGGLQQLSLRRCSGITEVSGLKSMHRLRRLDLSGTSVTDSVFAVARDLRELEELLLCDCAGIRDTANLAGAARLRKLDLSGSAIHSARVSQLRSKCPMLRTINVNGCVNLSGEGSGMMGAAKSALHGLFGRGSNTPSGNIRRA